MKGLKERVISAFVFLVIILIGIFGGASNFGFLVILISVFLLWEFFGIIISEESRSKSIHKALWTIAALIPVAWVFWKEFQGEAFDLYEFGPIALILIYIPLLFELFSLSSAPFDHVGGLFLGFFYITVPMCLLLDIAYVPAYSPFLILGLLLMTWLNDIGAYFVGSSIGKTPLAPTISPKKTWEGTLGGWATTILGGALYFHFFMEKPWDLTVAISVIAAVFGTLGDLVESKLKRTAGIKDTGRVMPGHGGLLDRFDAFIFFLPFIYLYLRFIGG